VHGQHLDPYLSYLSDDSHSSTTGLGGSSSDSNSDSDYSDGLRGASNEEGQAPKGEAGRRDDAVAKIEAALDKIPG